MVPADPDPPQPAAPARTPSVSVLLGCVLAWLGVLICFLLSQHSAARALLCPVRGGCETVLASPYATIAGVPLSWAGGAFYLLILVLLLIAYGTPSHSLGIRLLSAAHWIAMAGLTFSAGLMLLQFGVIRAFCPLCTLSFFVVGGLLLAVGKARRLAAAGPWSASPSGAMALALFAIFPSVILALGTRSHDEVLAVVGNHKLTRRQMETDLRTSLSPLRASIHTAESAWVKKEVDEVLLALEAKRLGSTAERILEDRLTAQPPVSDRQHAMDALRGELARRHRVEIYLRKPPLRSLRVDLSTAQLAGPPEAKVQLIVFSDFQCSFCQELAPVLKRVREEFPQGVLFGFRHFPLETHKRAFPAAVAAECAAEQGAFWEYHDKLFAEGGDLSDAMFLTLADSLRLDRTRFAECLKSQKPKQRVEVSRQDADASGLEAVPAIFLNGVRVEGELTHVNIVRQINEALRTQRSKKQP